jgi:putative peptidoglycan lipid II flippase
VSGAGGGRERVARNTAIFSIATGVLAGRGLAREIVAASFFGTRRARLRVHDRLPDPEPGRNLFANAALSAAFVPVFTDLLQQGKQAKRRSGSPRRCSGSC